MRDTILIYNGGYAELAMDSEMESQRHYVRDPQGAIVRRPPHLRFLKGALLASSRPPLLNSRDSVQILLDDSNRLPVLQEKAQPGTTLLPSQRFGR